MSTVFSSLAIKLVPEHYANTKYHSTKYKIPFNLQQLLI